MAYEHNIYIAASAESETRFTVRFSAITLDSSTINTPEALHSLLSSYPITGACGVCTGWVHIPNTNIIASPLSIAKLSDNSIRITVAYQWNASSEDIEIYYLDLDGNDFRGFIIDDVRTIQ